MTDENSKPWYGQVHNVDVFAGERLQRLIETAARTFGTIAAAFDWIRCPVPELNNRTPRELALESEDGLGSALAILEAIRGMQAPEHPGTLQ